MNLYLIDGYGFVFRAYHSLPPLYSPENIPIAAVYGFLNMIAKLLDNHSADMIAVALDYGAKNFRHEISPSYKANRPEAPHDLKVQFPIIREAIEALNIPSIEAEGFEADDLIATYVKHATASGYRTTVIASDKDLMQLLVNESVVLHDPIKNKNVSIEDAMKKFGVGPSHILDAIALIGDVSDNIPGVKGIGLKTVARLLEKYPSLENIYENIDIIEPLRLKNLLIADKENAFLSKKLAALNSEAPIRHSWEELKVKEPKGEHLSAFLHKYGFKSLFNKFGLSVKQVYSAKNMPAVEFIALAQIETLTAALPEVLRSGWLSLHIEGDALTISSQRINYLIPLLPEGLQGQMQLLEPLDGNSREKGFYFTQIIEVLAPVLTSNAVRKIMINAKEFLNECYKRGFDVDAKEDAIEDVGVLAYAIETSKYQYDIKSLMKHYLPEQTEVNSYSVYELYMVLRHKLFAIKGFALYETIDKPLITLLAAMERRGVKVDKDLLVSLSKEFTTKLEVLSEKIYSLAGGTFNIASPKQLGEILFNQLKIGGGKKSKKTQSYITDVLALEEIANAGHDIAYLILEWRQYSKLTNTYTDGLQKSIDSASRIHTSFEATSTATGRLSSRNPNLQNIPIRTEEGAKIRKAFIAEEGHMLLSADYSQIELRLLAHMADIKPLKKAFLQEQDVHAVTASQIFGVPLEQVDSQLRYRAKAVNFGIIYGISAFGLAKNLDITRNEAEHYIKLYFKQYPGIQQYMDQTVAFARENGFIKTLLGRRCYIQGLRDSNYARRTFAERMAINAPLQGTTADIVRRAMVQIPDSMRKYLVLQIHDELLLEIPEQEVEAVSKLVKQTMENAIKLEVPLTAELHCAKSWK